MYLTQAEAAKLCGVHITTIRRLRERKLLSTFRIEGVKKVMLSKEQVLALFKEVISK